MSTLRAPRAPRRPRISSAAIAGSAVLALLAVAGCGSDEGGGSGGDGALAVSASIYPMAFLAERIGGEHVDVTTLTAPGTDPHDLELSPQQIGQLGEADVIAYVAGLQPAVDDAIGQSGVSRIIEAGSVVHSEPENTDGEGNGEGNGDGDDPDHGADEDEDHGHDHAEEKHADDDHEHDHGGDARGDEDPDESAEDDDHDHDGHHHGHDHGDEDPHFWVDPLTYAVAAEGVASTLAEADPDNAADYQANLDQLTGELNDLDEEFETGLADRETSTIITTHAAFGYLAERYGLTEEAIAGLDPESEPSGARMRELHQIAERDGVTTVFFEVLASDAMAATLAEDLSLRTAVLDPLEGISEDSAGDDYFEVMRANLAALRDALGGTA